MDVNSMAILILLGSFFLMIMLRFPIAYAVALSSVFWTEFCDFLSIHPTIMPDRNNAMIIKPEYFI